MIIWLASYPKSGNTLVRSMLSAYLFTKDGNFNFEVLKNIKQFPDHALFKNLGINFNDENEVVKNYIKVQKEINKRDSNSIRFLKTHSAPNDINGYKFTDLNNTMGVIHIVRDPRKIISSYANHASISKEDALKRLLEIRIIGGKNDPLNKTVIHVGSWLSNYNAWKEFKKVDKYLLVKYEDLISDPEKYFISILHFIEKISKLKLVIDKNKLRNTLETTTFKNLQNLEKKIDFQEASINSEKKKIKFFKYGVNNDGFKNIPYKLKENLENSLKKEMIELGYL